MVEWKKVGDLINYLPGGALKRNEVKEEGLYPVMNGGIDYSGFFDEYNYDENVLTISHWGSSASHVHRHFCKFWANNACWVFVAKNKSECNLYYLYQVLKNRENIMMQTMCFGGATPNLNRSLFEKQIIPIPTLSEQNRIVGILDTFTNAIDNLKRQIELRKKQYEYYRDLLLDFEGKENVEVAMLNELFSFRNGLNKGKEYFGSGKPIIMFTNVFKSRYIKASMIKNRVNISKQELERINAKKGDVFFTRTSETKEEVGYASVLIDDIEECTFAGFLIRARPITNKIKPEYCKYCFSTPKIRQAIVSKSSFTTRASLTGNGLGNVIIHVPSLDEQNRIVSILDSFESSISNLEQQLALRQKQYEYYRNMLLTFDE